MKPFDRAWALLKEEVFGPKEHPLGRINFYHGTERFNADRIGRQGIKPHDETLSDFWEGPAEFKKPTVAVARDMKTARGYGDHVFGIRGTEEELGLTQRYPEIKGHDELNTFDTIPPERLLLVQGDPDKMRGRSIHSSSTVTKPAPRPITSLWDRVFGEDDPNLTDAQVVAIAQRMGSKTTTPAGALKFLRRRR